MHQCVIDTDTVNVQRSAASTAVPAGFTGSLAADRFLSNVGPNRSRGWLLFLSLALAMVVAVGCGGNRRPLTPVTGKVTYQGKPLRFGTVILQPESGQYATGAIQQDGTFMMTMRGEGDGAAVGRNMVRIVCLEGQDPAKAASANGRSRGEAGLGRSLIPEKYQSCETSGISVDVRPGGNDPVVLDLSSN